MIFVYSVNWMHSEINFVVQPINLIKTIELSFTVLLESKKYNLSSLLVECLFFVQKLFKNNVDYSLGNTNYLLKFFFQIAMQL